MSPFATPETFHGQLPSASLKKQWLASSRASVDFHEVEGVIPRPAVMWFHDPEVGVLNVRSWLRLLKKSFERLGQS